MSDYRPPCRWNRCHRADPDAADRMEESVARIAGRLPPALVLAAWAALAAGVILLLTR